jgi:hypothetical protein
VWSRHQERALIVDRLSKVPIPNSLDLETLQLAAPPEKHLQTCPEIWYYLQKQYICARHMFTCDVSCELSLPCTEQPTAYLISGADCPPVGASMMISPFSEWAPVA